MVLFFVYATVENKIVKTFLVKAPDALEAIRQLEACNGFETFFNEPPMYPTGSRLSAEPVEFDNEWNVLSID